jgi:hypothetical protein
MRSTILKMKLPRLNLIVFALLAALFLSGCQSRPLAPGGSYNGNQFAYTADQTIVTTGKALKTFLAFEKKNRASLGSDVREIAVKLRQDAPLALQLAAKAVQVYKESPTPENQDKVQVILKQTLDLLELVQATLARAQNETTKITTP